MSWLRHPLGEKAVKRRHVLLRSTNQDAFVVPHVIIAVALALCFAAISWWLTSFQALTTTWT